MPNYKITYYTSSDSIATAFIAAPNLDAAIETLVNDTQKPYTQIKEYSVMTTTPTTPAQQAAELFRTELRNALDEIMAEMQAQHVEIANIRADLDAMRAGLTQAAAKPQTPATPTDTFLADAIVHDYSNDKHAYKLRGGKYAKNGVRIWPEVLATIMPVDDCQLGITKLTPPMLVTVEIAKRPGKSDLGEDPNLQYNYARKVIGKA